MKRDDGKKLGLYFIRYPLKVDKGASGLLTLFHAIGVYMNVFICLPLGAPNWRRPATTDLEA
jgi:hypothetical protein